MIVTARMASVATTAIEVRRGDVAGPERGLGHGADEPWIRGVIASFSSELRPMTVPPEATRGAGTSLFTSARSTGSGGPSPRLR